MSVALLLDDLNIVLDPQIRDWVLLPIVLVMFGQGETEGERGEER